MAELRIEKGKMTQRLCIVPSALNLEFRSFTATCYPRHFTADVFFYFSFLILMTLLFITMTPSPLVQIGAWTFWLKIGPQGLEQLQVWENESISASVEAAADHPQLCEEEVGPVNASGRILKTVSSSSVGPGSSSQ